ncbi:extracellular solute-binding protein [Limnochorda pilosa]|uniref:ABC transporter substrate-binding protein n=1 Tax=Limnochorda pilosa TaxID=1555112 RepID=A0A0K2SJ61_LIMPI|nr:extracellular solute-binding protein [Limnochorda pilosa]BAS27130.1 ABC transporter substrate-binding protein [Limnochorda pilosa]
MQTCRSRLLGFVCASALAWVLALGVASLPAAGAGGTLNVLYMAQAGYQPDDVRAMADLFEEVSDAKVNLTFVKYDEMHEKIVTSAIAPVATYDVVLLDLIWTAEFASRRMVAPLDDFITPQMRADIKPAILDAFVFDGKTWAMPFLANFQLFFYNQRMIEQAGFSGPPQTLEEMVEQMKAMKAKGIVSYPWTDSWNQKEGLTCEFVWLTGAFGGDTFDAQGRPVFNRGPGLKALEFMVRLLDEGLANPKSLTNDEAAAKDDFIAGNAAFTTNWTFQYGLMNDPSVSKVVGDGRMGLIPVAADARAAGARTASVSGFQGAAIMANSRSKELAWKYVRFITSPLVQRAFLQEMPVWTSVQQSAYAQTMDPVIGVKAEQLGAVHHRPKVPPYPEVSSIMQRYIHLALEKKMTPQQALDAAVREINGVL